MKVLEPGIVYALENYSDNSTTQIVRFYTKLKQQDAEFYNVSEVDGSTIEEMYKVLMHRLEYLNNKGQSLENSYALKALKESFFWINERKRERGKNNNNDKRTSRVGEK